jgi:hypothetical protein
MLSGRRKIVAAVTAGLASRRVAIQKDCGSKKKNWNHPGKGWAKGHNKNC